MNERLQWYDEAKTIAIIEQTQQPSWQHWHETSELITQVLEATPHRVDFILTNAVGIPVGNPLPHLTRTMDIMEGYVDKLGMIVMVGSGTIAVLMNAFLDIALRATNRPAHTVSFTPSVEIALSRIMELRKEQNP